MKKKIFLAIMSLTFLAPIFGRFYSMYQTEDAKSKNLPSLIETSEQ